MINGCMDLSISSSIHEFSSHQLIEICLIRLTLIWLRKPDELALVDL